MPEPSPLARRDVTLLDLVDSILQRGAVLNGDLTLAVADVDLVQVNLRALLASVETVRRLTPSTTRNPAINQGRQDRKDAAAADATAQPAPPRPMPPQRSAPSRSTTASRRRPAPLLHGHRRRGTDLRIDTDPNNVERGLAQLVLTVIELLRQLMERQALYRMEGGSLSDEEVERLGQTFLKLEDRMEQLKKDFGLEDEELNLHLGPLGDLL